MPRSGAAIASRSRFRHITPLSRGATIATPMSTPRRLRRGAPSSRKASLPFAVPPFPCARPAHACASPSLDPSQAPSPLFPPNPRSGRTLPSPRAPTPIPPPCTPRSHPSSRAQKKTPWKGVQRQDKLNDPLLEAKSASTWMKKCMQNISGRAARAHAAVARSPASRAHPNPHPPPPRVVRLARQSRTR